MFFTFICIPTRYDFFHFTLPSNVFASFPVSSLSSIAMQPVGRNHLSATEERMLDTLQLPEQ